MKKKDFFRSFPNEVIYSYLKNNNFDGLQNMHEYCMCDLSQVLFNSSCLCSDCEPYKTYMHTDGISRQWEQITPEEDYKDCEKIVDEVINESKKAVNYATTTKSNSRIFSTFH